MSVPENLLDQMAMAALNALISKMPLYDSKGEFGNKVSEDKLKEIKVGITKTAYEYASYMLIAREDSKQWLQENREINPSLGI